MGSYRPVANEGLSRSAIGVEDVWESLLSTATLDVDIARLRGMWKS
jgi:hypothetical protein